MTTPTTYAMGTSASTIPLHDLPTPIPFPRPPLKLFVELSQMASGKFVGRGLPTITWAWGFITQAQRDQLRSFCPGASAIIYIDTISLENADQFRQYKCIMKWPEEEDRQTTRRVSFNLEFVHCELQP